MVSGHRNKCYLPSWNDREKRERSGRRMHERKQRDRRRKERWDKGGKRGKDKKQKKINKSEAERNRKENTGRAEPRAGRSFAPGPCRAAQASPSPRRGAGMPFPTSTILLLCFFLSCFVLSAHKPRPRVSVNFFQVPVSRHPAAPPLPATAASRRAQHHLCSPPRGQHPGAWGQPRAPQPGKSRPAEC